MGGSKTPTASGIAVAISIASLAISVTGLAIAAMTMQAQQQQAQQAVAQTTIQLAGVRPTVQIDSMRIQVAPDTTSLRIELANTGKLTAIITRLSLIVAEEGSARTLLDLYNKEEQNMGMVLTAQRSRALSIEAPRFMRVGERMVDLSKGRDGDDELWFSVRYGCSELEGSFENTYSLRVRSDSREPERPKSIPDHDR